MSLHQKSREYESQMLCFKPNYGWGWSRLGTNDADRFIDFAEIDTAGVFYIRVSRFFSFEGELRGLIGRVEQDGHLFDGLWAATWTMLEGEFDFVEKLCFRWDIELGPTEPHGGEWPTTPESSPAYSGYGVVGVSPAAIARFWEELM